MVYGDGSSQESERGSGTGEQDILSAICAAARFSWPVTGRLDTFDSIQFHRNPEWILAIREIRTFRIDVQVLYHVLPLYSE